METEMFGFEDKEKIEEPIEEAEVEETPWEKRKRLYEESRNK